MFKMVPNNARCNTPTLQTQHPMTFQILPYQPSMRSEWDNFASHARQQSLLFQRGFMDYHSDRFKDASLIVVDEKGHWKAILPANISRSDSTRIESHGGLTYGGLLTTESLTACETGEALRLALLYYKDKGYRTFLYKPTPEIYHTYPSGEDLYWIAQLGGTLLHRALSSAILLTQPLSFSTLRRRKVHKAQRTEGLIHETSANRLPAFWDVLSNVLREHHHTTPVHTLSEMQLLMQRFPSHIVLHTLTRRTPARSTDEEGSEVLAGCVVFHTTCTAHVQYIAASEEGRNIGALDLLFHELREQLTSQPTPCRYLDFGISTESHGEWLNRGLIFQKEGFGARGVCYDEYAIDLAENERLKSAPSLL